MKKSILPVLLLGLVTLAPLKVMAKPVPISFNICGEDKNWVRPNLEQQIKRLQNVPMFGFPSEQSLRENLQTGQASLVWQNPIISFDTYGLHLYAEVLYQSGIWTLPEEKIERCLAEDNVMKVRDGEMAWIFLLQHKVRSLKWQKNHYVLEIEPTKTGLQVIQFDRQDKQKSLPLVIIDNNKYKLKSSSYGWEDSITTWY